MVIKSKESSGTSAAKAKKTALDVFCEGASTIGFFQSMDDRVFQSDRDALASDWRRVGSDLKKAIAMQSAEIRHGK